MNDPMSLQQCEDFCLGDQTSSCAYLLYLSLNSTCLVAPAIKPINGVPRGYVGDGDYLQNTCRGTKLVGVSADYKASAEDSSWYSRAQRQPPPMDHQENTTFAQDRQLNAQTSPRTGFQTNTQAGTGLRIHGQASSQTGLQTNSQLGTQTSRQTSVQATQAHNATVSSVQNSTAVTTSRSSNTQTSPLSGKTVVTTTSSKPVNLLNNTTAFFPEDADLRGLPVLPPDEGAGCRFTRTNGRIVGGFVASTAQNVELDACKLQCEASNSCLSFSHSVTEKLCLTSAENLGKAPGMINTTSGNDFAFYEKGNECTDSKPNVVC